MAFPPLFKILKLNWLRYQGARKTLPHLSDTASRREFMRHVRRNLSFTRLSTATNHDAPLLSLRINELDGETIYCRSGLSDLGVVYDTFEGQFHLPPPGLGPVRAILDLGSNIGLTIAHYAARFPEARILGVELDRGNFEVCLRNTEGRRSRCEVINAAVWHEPGEITYGGVRESGYAISAGESAGARTAPAVTLDSLIDRLGVETVDFVKMDIEGAEQEVLGKAGSWIGKVRCIKVEVHPEKASTLYTLGNCIEDLERHGMKCTVDARHHACVVGVRK